MRERAAELLAWYATKQRDLPWRRTSDPWAIWVSEVMLQQTRVEAVRDRFVSFLETYGTPAAFARASDDEVLSSWRGLGYYRRARALREGARRIVADHGGSVPADADALRNLPGVGDYTLGAIASIAFDMPLPAIDGNVERVLTRVLAIAADPKTKAARDLMRSEIQALHQEDSPREINQALMELGATLCSPRKPRCEDCPWSGHCRALREDRVADYPRASERPKAIDVATEVLVARQAGLLLMRRVPLKEVNGGQLCLPGLGIPTPKAQTLVPYLRTTHGIDFQVTEPRATFRHSITKWRIQVVVREAIDPPGSKDLPRNCDLTYVDFSVDEAPTTTITRKALKALN